MNTKHTPGPWGGFMQGTEMVVVPVQARLDVSSEEGKANAKLITAAPELLNDHTEMLAFIRGYAQSADADDPVHEMLKRYEATNAKATGN